MRIASPVASRPRAAHVLRMALPAPPAGSGFAGSLSRRRLLFGAALGGGALGGLFGVEIAQAAAGVWSGHFVPAFFELLLSGIPFCG